ncbi:hypothetical protein GQ457_10G022760 [Hibiscus cannabinus]
MAELSRADFKYVDPNWSRFECLVQIAAKFDEERSQINHDHGQSLCKKENTGLKQRFTFNNNAGKKTKREFKGEDDDGEWEGGLKPELKRSKKQRFTFNNNAGKKMKREFKEEDGDEEWESGLKPKLTCPIPTPDLPDRFKRHISENMGGSGPVLVIQKALFFSDVNPTASRLSVPFSQVKTHDFLKSTEADALANQSPMEVCLLGPSMEKTTMTLNRWEMGKTSLYGDCKVMLCTGQNLKIEANKNYTCLFFILDLLKNAEACLQFLIFHKYVYVSVNNDESCFMMVKCKGFPEKDEATTTWKSKTNVYHFWFKFEQAESKFFVGCCVSGKNEGDIGPEAKLFSPVLFGSSMCSCSYGSLVLNITVIVIVLGSSFYVEVAMVLRTRLTSICFHRCFGGGWFLGEPSADSMDLVLVIICGGGKAHRMVGSQIPSPVIIVSFKLGRFRNGDCCLSMIGSTVAKDV